MTEDRKKDPADVTPEPKDEIHVEQYTVILKHEYVSEKARFELDEPIVMKMSFYRPHFSYGNAMTINEIFEKMKQEALKRLSRTEALR